MMFEICAGHNSVRVSRVVVRYPDKSNNPFVEGFDGTSNCSQLTEVSDDPAECF